MSAAARAAAIAAAGRSETLAVSGTPAGRGHVTTIATTIRVNSTVTSGYHGDAPRTHVES
jgi:hypothetical protein